MIAVIHCQPRIGWQGPFAEKLAEGLKRVGIKSIKTDDKFRHDEGFPILLGTTLWRDIERRGEFLLVDRCSFGDTNKNVSLVWNGHGRRGDHKVPLNYDSSRWEKNGVELQPWKRGWRRVVCGQTESYCERDLKDWYKQTGATFFRPHPAGENPTGLPVWNSFDECELITLNSSVAVQGLINGVRTDVWDEGGMAYGTDCNDESRLRLMHWLAWTQWTHDEIKEGTPWVTLLS